jgi:hypothetical protein
VPSLKTPLTPRSDDSESQQSDICPTFAITKIDKDEGILHKVCIDTGSSISCIDYDYVKKHLRNHEIKTTSNLRLMGIGTNMTTGTIDVTLHMVTTDPEKPYHCQVTLYIVPRLNTKIILGNDQLVPMKAKIDLENNLMTFATHNNQVVISSTSIADNRLLRRTARTMKDLYVARSVAKADSDIDYAMLCNLGRSVIRIPACTLVGHPSGVIEQDANNKDVNLILGDSRSDPSFEEDIAKLDINAEVTEDQQESTSNTPPTCCFWIW